MVAHEELRRIEPVVALGVRLKAQHFPEPGPSRRLSWMFSRYFGLNTARCLDRGSVSFGSIPMTPVAPVRRTSRSGDRPRSPCGHFRSNSSPEMEPESGRISSKPQARNGAKTLTASAEEE